MSAKKAFWSPEWNDKIKEYLSQQDEQRTYSAQEARVWLIKETTKAGDNFTTAQVQSKINTISTGKHR